MMNMMLRKLSKIFRLQLMISLAYQNSAQTCMPVCSFYIIEFPPD